jgi:hypothetical protein
MEDKMNIFKKLILLTTVVFIVFSCNLENTNQETDNQMEGLTVQNASIRILNGKEAGFSPDLFPQINVISKEDYDAMTAEEMDQAYGLYIVGADYIPFYIEESLAEDSLTLENDGRLIDNKTGTETVLFMEPNSIEIIPAASSKGSADNFTASWSATIGRDYHFPWDFTYWNRLKIWTYRLGTSTAKNVELIRCQLSTGGRYNTEFIENGHYLNTKSSRREWGKHVYEHTWYFRVENKEWSLTRSWTSNSY